MWCNFRFHREKIHSWEQKNFPTHRSTENEIHPSYLINFRFIRIWEGRGKNSSWSLLPNKRPRREESSTFNRRSFHRCTHVKRKGDPLVGLSSRGHQSMTPRRHAFLMPRCRRSSLNKNKDSTLLIVEGDSLTQQVANLTGTACQQKKKEKSPMRRRYLDKFNLLEAGPHSSTNNLSKEIPNESSFLFCCSFQSQNDARINGNSIYRLIFRSVW